MTQQPVHEIRLGRVKAAIWANETTAGIRHNATFTRIYKDGEQWKDRASFGRDDLPLLARVADLVHTWIFEQDRAESTPAQPTPEEPLRE